MRCLSVDGRVWSVQAMESRRRRTLPSSSRTNGFLQFTSQLSRVVFLSHQRHTGQALEFVNSAVKQNFIDTSDTRYGGLSRLCSYGANQDSNSSCYRGMPAIKEARHPVTTSLPWGSSA